MIRKVKIVPSLVLIGLVLAVPAVWASYDAGVNAYRSRDYRRALQEFKSDGSPASQYVLGIMYFKGEGVEADKGRAVKLLRAAAGRGHLKAQYSLAVICDKGDGVLQDQKEAAKWYRKAAEQGHAQSQFNLGLMYTNGEGVGKDRAEAVKWLRKSAGQGNVNAQKLLGVMGEKP
ncbi:MAG TPA: tetratricopeptide repeat protein [Geobacteraceae bacterium]|nr:tetratricopeptide repeat protein [Geobacteraceae bacterium]